MRWLLAEEGEAALSALAEPGTLLVFDFDGTLAPVVPNRNAAQLTRRTRELLTSAAERYPVAVLSGRARADVEERVRGTGVRWVIGSHGADFPEGLGPDRGARCLVWSWRTILARRVADLPGVELEEKPYCFAIHYRRAPDPGRTLRLVASVVESLPGVRVVPGKRVLNLVPSSAPDKGGALRRLVELAQAARVLFVGDDETDEIAFRADIHIPKVTVRVGVAGASHAVYRLRCRADVDRVLATLVKLRGSTRPRLLDGSCARGPWR